MTEILEFVMYREPVPHSDDKEAATAHVRAIRALLREYGWTVGTASLDGTQIPE